MVPPLPAASRPSKITITRSPFSFTQSCRAHSLPCSRVSSFTYCLFLSFLSAIIVVLLSRPALRLPAAPERAVELGARPQLGTARLRQQQLLLEQVLIGGQDLDVAGEAGVVTGAREVGRIHQGRHADLPLHAHLGQLLNRHQRVGHLAVAVERGLAVES